MSESRGWLISVHSKPLSGNESAIKLYAARIADPAAAILAVRRYARISDERLQIIVETTILN